MSKLTFNALFYLMVFIKKAVLLQIQNVRAVVIYLLLLFYYYIIKFFEKFVSFH